MNLEDRKRGCMFGLAVGDALGAPVEFRDPGSFAPVTTYRSGGAHGLNTGEWTDDTSIALALADSLANGWDVHDQLTKYLEWYQDGKYSVNGWCFDIGGTTKYSLAKFAETDRVDCADTSESAAGNGSIMRLAPIPIKYAHLFPDKWEELMDLGKKSSATTHASKQCQTACGWLSVILAGLINGVERDKLLSDATYMKNLHPNVLGVVSGSYRLLNPPEIKGTGYVVESLEAALWAFHKANSFEEAVLAAVNLGEDADTTGAVCGQLAGAYWGYSGIPAEWKTGLAKADFIDNILSKIL